MDGSSSGKPVAEVSVHSAQLTPEASAQAALEQLNECIERISPELKRRLAETADAAEPIIIQGWGREECRSQLQLAAPFRDNAAIDPATVAAMEEAFSVFGNRARITFELVANAKLNFWEVAQDAHVATIEALREETRPREGYWLVGAEIARWLARPTVLNLRDSEVAAHIEAARGRIEALRSCIDGAETASVNNLVRAFVYSDALVIDVAASCRAEMRWINSELTINTGAARAAPVNLERRALDDRVRSVVELGSAGRRFLATRRLILYRAVSLVGSEMSPEAYAATIRDLFADMIVPANYPATLHAEMTRWAAEPWNPYGLPLGVPASAATGLDALATCVNGRSEAMRALLMAVTSQTSMHEVLTEQLIACYGPMMGMAQQRSADVYAAEFRALQVLTRRLHVYPRAIAGAIVAIHAGQGDRTFDQHVAGLQVMPAAAEFVTPALVHSLERFRF